MEQLNETNYDEIRILSWPESVRSKIGMYIDNSTGMLREILDNATDEVLASMTSGSKDICDLVVVDNKNYNGYNVVADNGRGIPIIMCPDKPDQTMARVSISVLHSGSKFKNSDPKSGTYGLGSAIVCAASSEYWLLSKITQHNYDKSLPCVKTFYDSLGPRSKKDIFYFVHYKCGYLESEGAAKKKDIEAMMGISRELPANMSTIVAFQVDPTIFSNTKAEIPVENLTNFLFIQEKFYRRKVTIVVNDAPMTSSGYTPYKFEILKTITPACPDLNPFVGVYCTFECDPSLAQKSSKGSVNGLVVDGGVHISFLETCYQEALKAEYKISHKTLLPGLKMKAIILAEDLVYDSQIKSRLKSISKVKQSDFSEITKEFQKIFRKNDDYWRPHVEKLNALAESYRSIGAYEKAQKMIDSSKGNLSFRMKGQNYVEGFSDATTTDRWKAELFLCEGLSASAGLKSGRRSSLYHAILPLRGKILSVKDVSVEEALANKEIFTMLSTIGLGIDVNFVGMSCQTPEETYAEIQKHARYGKIVIATDSDSDGSHISNLILYLFSKYARFLIDYGMVYILQSPLYEQNGKFWFPGDPMQPGTNLPVGLDIKKGHWRRWKGFLK